MARRATIYRTLSRRYAAEKNALLAVSSMWAADLSSAEMLTWERVIQSSGHPDQNFFGYATAICASLGQFAVSRAGYFKNAQDLVDSARKSLNTALDPSMRTLMHDQLAPTNHLRLLPAPTLDDVYESVTGRLQGLTADVFVYVRRTEAEGLLDRSAIFHDGGDVNSALNDLYDAHMLFLEAYLVESALAVGDTGLLTVQLRWDLVAESIKALAELPASFEEAAIAIERTIAESLGPLDAARWMTSYPDAYQPEQEHPQAS